MAEDPEGIPQGDVEAGEGTAQEAVPSGLEVPEPEPAPEEDAAVWQQRYRETQGQYTQGQMTLRETERRLAEAEAQLAEAQTARTTTTTPVPDLVTERQARYEGLGYEANDARALAEADLRDITAAVQTYVAPVMLQVSEMTYGPAAQQAIANVGAAGVTPVEVETYLRQHVDPNAWAGATAQARLDAAQQAVLAVGGQRYYEAQKKLTATGRPGTPANQPAPPILLPGVPASGAGSLSGREAQLVAAYEGMGMSKEAAVATAQRAARLTPQQIEEENYGE